MLCAILTEALICSTKYLILVQEVKAKSAKGRKEVNSLTLTVLLLYEIEAF